MSETHSPTWLKAERFFLDLDVTTHFPRFDSNKKLNDDHVSKRSLCIYMYTKDLFIAEATIQKQHVNERHSPGHYSHLAVLAIVKNYRIIT